MGDANKLMAMSIYNSLYNALNGSGDLEGQKPPEPTGSYLALQPSGRFIDPKDYANPWTPGNPKGNRAAAVNLAALADECHLTNPAAQPTTTRLSQIYAEVLRANVDPQPEDPDAKQALERANKLLYRDVTEVDPETGEKKPKHVESAALREYQSLRQKYLTARSAYVASYLKAQETEAGRDTWPELAPTLRGPVDSAWEEWRGADANEIENALAVTETTGRNQVALAFAQAQQVFDSYGADLTGAGTPLTYRSTVTPTSWTDPDAAQDWPVMTIEQGFQEKDSSEESTSYSANAGGLWGWGASVDHSDHQDDLSQETKNLKVSFRYCLCVLSRPWMNTLLFGMPHWHTNAFPPGRLSDGKRQQDAAAVLPLITTAFLCVRDLTITAKWGRSDLSHAASSTKMDAGYSFGPFRLTGGSYSDEKKSSHRRADWDGTTLSQKGLQIIGWVHQIVPFCPPGANP